MTKWEIKEYENRCAVVQFLKDKNISASDLVRYAKALCCCGSCHFFEQHYTKEGEALDWGHCFRGNIQHSKKISTACCGFWEDGGKIRAKMMAINEEEKEI